MITNFTVSNSSLSVSKISNIEEKKILSSYSMMIFLEEKPSFSAKSIDREEDLAAEAALADMATEDESEDLFDSYDKSDFDTLLRQIKTRVHRMEQALNTNAARACQRVVCEWLALQRAIA